ncbi:hypothetical protein MPSEU_000973500 [Mayamaea pseudoterrestris]|nr:hypothetical protein MPSEU_000973500 [Mayamaea pseudoterrestris]
MMRYILRLLAPLAVLIVGVNSQTNCTVGKIQQADIVNATIGLQELVAMQLDICASDDTPYACNHEAIQDGFETSYNVWVASCDEYNNQSRSIDLITLTWTCKNSSQATNALVTINYSTCEGTGSCSHQNARSTWEASFENMKKALNDEVPSGLSCDYSNYVENSFSDQDSTSTLSSSVAGMTIYAWSTALVVMLVLY